MSNLSKKVLSLILGVCIVATLFAASTVPAFAKVDTTKFTEDFQDGTLENVLTYTGNDGITERDDFVTSSLDNFADKKFLTWNNADTTAQAGIHQRLNIAKELSDGSKLTSFSFKMPLTSTANKYHPALVILGKNSDTTQSVVTVGGRHDSGTAAFLGFGVSEEYSVNPTGNSSYSGSAWNSQKSATGLTGENGLVMVTYTFTIDYSNNKIYVSAYKPIADGVDGSAELKPNTVELSTQKLYASNIKDWDFAITQCRISSGNDNVYITDLEMTYQREYVSDEWIKEVNPNTADAEKVLSYTTADGQTVMEPVVTNIAGANAVTWNSKLTTGASGENHQRINIASEKNGLPLVSFSFKSLVVTDNANAAPVYILFGSNEDTTKQTAVVLGGRKTDYLSYGVKEDISNPATGSVNGSTSLFNKNTTGKYTDVENEVAAEIGKEYYRFTVKLYGNIAKITAENLDAQGNVEWSGELQKDIDLSAVANPYYAISSGWETTAKPVYVTDVQPIYAEPEMLGATIRKDASASEQDIMFGSQIKIADSIADGYTPAGYGMLLARTADIQGAAMTADAENVKVTNLYREAGEDTDFLYCVTINKSAIAGNTGKKFSARSYVKYVKAGADDIYVYSEQIAKSVYGYAKDMAADVIASGKVEATYEVAGATVNYVAENITAVMNGKSADISFDGTNKNEDHLLAFIYANREYNA